MQSARFASLESYSSRFAAKPVLTETRRHASISSTPAPTKPSATIGSVVLRPCEVVDFPRSGTDTDRPLLKAYRRRAAGEFTQAVAAYQDTLLAAPQCLPAAINLGVCLMKLGRVDEALELYEDWIKREDADPRVLYNAAILKVLKEERQSARKLLGLAAELAQPPLADDIAKLLEALEGQKPLKVDERRQVCSNPVSRCHSKHHSFSAPKGADAPRLMMWGIFRTVDQVTTRPATTMGYMRNKVQEKQQVKASFITAPKRRKGHFRRKSDETEYSRGRISSALSGDEPELMKFASFKSPPLTRVRMHGALLEEDLEDERTLRQAQVDQALDYSVRTKAVEVGAVIRREADKLFRLRQLLPPQNLEEVFPHKLSDESLHLVKSELRKDPQSRDFNLLLREVSKLKFFGKFQPEVRRKFLKIGELHTATQQEFLFRQGDSGHYMYVILHGSVVVVRLSPEYGEDPLIVNTLYDGESFGELSLFATSGRSEGRSASCQAGEHTDLLKIPKAAYHEIMLSEIQNQLEHKIKFLGELPFFQGVQQTQLIPLASNLDPETYGFSQAIVKKGQKPKGMYVVLSGYCNVYSEGFCLRPKNLAAYASARIRSPPPPSFRTGNTAFHSPRPSTFDTESGQTPGPAITPEELERSPELRSAVQTFFRNNDLASLLETNYITEERIFKRALKPRDFFSSRTLLEGSFDETTGRVHSLPPCKFSVAAESSSVQVLVVTRSQLPLLGDRLMRQLRDYLLTVDDCDCPEQLSEQAIEEEFRQWTKFKARLVDDTRREMFARRNKHRPTAAL